MPNTDEPLSGRQMPSSFDENHDFYNEKPFQKVLRKLKEEPLVPLGAGLTVFAFVSAWRAIRRGDSTTANRMFRARVAAQGFTVIAMVVGGMYYNKDRQASAELRKLKDERDNEEKRQKWIRELEARDEEEKSFKAAIRERRSQMANASAGAATEVQQPDTESTKQNGGGSGGVLGALGLSGWGSTSSKPSEPAEPTAEEIRRKVDEETAAVRAKIRPPVKPKGSAAAAGEDKPEESK